MAGAVIITHGDLAQSLLRAAESITGTVEGIKAISVNKGDATEGIRSALASAVKSVDTGRGVIIFTDMFGGTPTNIALSLLSAGKVEVITGANLPVLLKFLSHRAADKPIGELALQLKEYGKGSIVLAADMLKEKK